MGDSLIPCKKKGCRFSEEHLHHLVPKAIGGKDSDGRVYLCKKHHDILHNILISRIWKYVPDDKKEECRREIERFSKWWAEKEW